MIIGTQRASCVAMLREKASNNTAPLSAGITTEKLAVAIGFHEESVRRAIRQNRIRAIRFGRTWRIPGDEVTRILSQGLPA